MNRSGHEPNNQLAHGIVALNPRDCHSPKGFLLVLPRACPRSPLKLLRCPYSATSAFRIGESPAGLLFAGAASVARFLLQGVLQGVILQSDLQYRCARDRGASLHRRGHRARHQRLRELGCAPNVGIRGAVDAGSPREVHPGRA